MYLILDPADIFFLTGIRPHDVGEILILLSMPDTVRRRNIILCDPRTAALFDPLQYDIIDMRDVWEDQIRKIGAVTVDPEYITLALQKKFTSWGAKLHYKESPITKKRTIKTSQEIKKLQISQAKNKAVYEKILPHIILGVTEEALARKIQILQLEEGASSPSFPPIVAFGENSAIPHHSPTKRPLQRGDMVLIDMGLVYEGYCSDMTRMVYREDIPDEARRIGELVTQVTKKIINWAKPGMKVSEIDKKAREMLGEYAQYCTHSLGHGVGINIHEKPFLSSKSSDILESGMVITIEPGIYLPGKYGARYEEMGVVNHHGCELL